MAQQTGAIYHQGILYSGGGGTEVTPNPQGEATDTLNTVEIDGTVYGIEGGGDTVLIDSAIDESRCLFKSAEITKFNQTPVTYTATEDCYAICIFKGSTGTNMYPIINGTPILLKALNDMISTILPLKKGDVISNRYDEVSESCYFIMFIYGRKPADAISAPVIYSDEERRIGVWRDNKPLYQRTFSATSPSVIDTSTSIIIMPTGIENVVHLTGFINQVGAIAQENLNFYIWYRKTQNDIACRVTNQNWVNYPMFVTVWYTKTSDTEGSGEYNTLAIPNVHYSTDEQVIGTWIDGKPLYRKVIEFTGGNTIAAGHDDLVVLNEDTSLLNVKRWIKTTCVTYDYGSSITTDVFGTLSVKSIHGAQAQIYNAKITDTIILPSTGNYIIAEYTKTTD